MRRSFRHQILGVLGTALLALVASGCGRGNRSDLDVVPKTDTARAGLEKALTAWKNGEKCGKIQASGPAIEVVDRMWKAGAKLTAFEIVRAEDMAGPRWFAVRLTLANSAQPQEVKYAVLGIDPLWVFREEDFQKTTGM